jgi:hypothetical protein
LRLSPEVSAVAKSFFSSVPLVFTCFLGFCFPSELWDRLAFSFSPFSSFTASSVGFLRDSDFFILSPFFFFEKESFLKRAPDLVLGFFATLSFSPEDDEELEELASFLDLLLPNNLPVLFSLDESFFLSGLALVASSEEDDEEESCS